MIEFKPVKEGLKDIAMETLFANEGDVFWFALKSKSNKWMFDPHKGKEAKLGIRDDCMDKVNDPTFQWRVKPRPDLGNGWIELWNKATNRIAGMEGNKGDQT